MDCTAPKATPVTHKNKLKLTHMLLILVPTVRSGGNRWIWRTETPRRLRRARIGNPKSLEDVEVDGDAYGVNRGIRRGHRRAGEFVSPKAPQSSIIKTRPRPTKVQQLVISASQYASHSVDLAALTCLYPRSLRESSAVGDTETN